jgi:hypothetical protein
VEYDYHRLLLCAAYDWRRTERSQVSFPRGARSAGFRSRRTKRYKKCVVSGAGRGWMRVRFAGRYARRAWMPVEGWGVQSTWRELMPKDLNHGLHRRAVAGSCDLSFVQHWTVSNKSMRLPRASCRLITRERVRCALCQT